MRVTRQPPPGPVWAVADGMIVQVWPGSPPPALAAWYHPGGWWATPDSWPWNGDGSPADFDATADGRVDSGGDDGS